MRLLLINLLLKLLARLAPSSRPEITMLALRLFARESGRPIRRPPVEQLVSVVMSAAYTIDIAYYREHLRRGLDELGVADSFDWDEKPASGLREAMVKAWPSQD